MTIDLPLWPPSNNVYYRNVNGRTILSKRGRIFLEDGVRYITPLMNRQIPFAGRLGVNIKLYPPCKRKRDVDNFLKAVLDLMTKAGVWQDDITNIQQAASYLGLGETLVSKLTGGSAVLDIGTRKAIKEAIDRMSKRKFEQYTEIRKRYDTMGQQQGFGSSKYMRPEMKYQPGEAPAAAQQRSLNNMPSDVQPVGRRRNYRGRNR